jgi:hypothetical protein
MSHWRMHGRTVRASVRVSAGGTRRLRTGSAARKGQQRDIASALDRHAEPALVTRADAGHAARKNLAALLHELRKNVRALVVDHVHLFDAELADLLLAEILTLAARASAGTTGTSRAAFAARTAGTAFAAWATGAALATRTGVASRTSAWSVASAFALWSARGSVRLGLLLFLCHNVVPFPFASACVELGKFFDSR